jgi:DNA repair exonuclease SbcCD ATPase subunit
MEALNIIQLTAENFKKLKAVEIRPDSNAVIISGKNGAGKSSVLDSIVAALCGAKKLPVKPIRDGEKSAKIELQIGDYTIQRTFTESKSYLEITSKGRKISSPQALLDKLVGEISFDPMKFIQGYDGRQQRQILMKLVGLDFSDIDQQIEDLRQRRSVVRAKKDGLEHESMPVVGGLPEQESSAADLIAEHQRASDHNTRIRAEKEQISIHEREYALLQQEAEAISRQIGSLKSRLDQVKDQASNRVKLMDSLLENAEDFIDTAAISDRIVSVEQTNLAIRQNIQAKLTAAKIEELGKLWSADGDLMKSLEDEKTQRLAAVTMPVAGLSIDETGILFDGIPLAQVNTAKQLEVAVAISMALNPELRVILMNGNDLDTESMQSISAMVADRDYQIWIEKVDESGTVGIYIEDGEIAEPF